MTERSNYVRVRLQLDAVASSMSAARKCWLLVNVSQSQVIADLMHTVAHRFRVTHNCSLYLDDYWLPPGESTMILKDNDIIKVVSSERADNLNYQLITTALNESSSGSSSSSSSSSDDDDDNDESHQRVDVQPNLSLKSDTKVLQSGATHIVFNDSDTELMNNVNTSTTTVLATSNITPQLESKKNADVNGLSQSARRNRRRRNRKKARKLQLGQQPVGGENDVLVAVSKIFKNSTDNEGCLENKTISEMEASLLSNDSYSNGQENQTNVEIEDTDDFGVDFTVDFDSCPELSGTPRLGDILAYKELEMSAAYTPEISAYKVCKVIGLNSDARIVQVQLSWTTYKAKCMKVTESQKRKFELDTTVSEEATTIAKELELELDHLNVVRLLPAT